jgi:nucleoid-associated protein YgaU
MARHAVAIDERRVLFPCELWDNVAELNEAKGFTPDDPRAPYQQKWFPGVHGSVGGGGDIPGLSDGALAWIIKGAKDANLVLDRAHGTRIFGFRPHPFAPLDNMTKPDRDITYAVERDRLGPQHLWEVSFPAIRRWHASSARLPEQVAYRPPTLANVADALNAFPLAEITASDVPIRCEHIVKDEDTLQTLARDYYGNPARWDMIFQANRNLIDDPDDLVPGWPLRIPQIETAVA